MACALFGQLGEARALDSRAPGAASWALSEPAEAQARPPDPFSLWAACSSTASAGWRPPGEQEGGQACFPASSLLFSGSLHPRIRVAAQPRAVSVLWSRALASPLALFLSVSRECPLRRSLALLATFRARELPAPCPRAREGSALSRGAACFPFPFVPRLGERAGLGLGTVAPTLPSSARGRGAHIGVELVVDKFGPQQVQSLRRAGLGAGEEKLETTASGGRARSTAGRRSGSPFFFFFSPQF